MNCPFIGVFDDVECVYLDRRRCDDIEINPGNGDAWCHQMIARAEAICPVCEDMPTLYCFHCDRVVFDNEN